MPYRLDVGRPPHDAVDRLIDLGALDVEAADEHVAALMPDAVSLRDVTRALGSGDVRVTPALGRDDDSVWVLRPRPIHSAGLTIVPADDPAPPAGALRLVDSTAFGTGLHPTTTLCLEAIRDAVDAGGVERMLDVGTGSGVLVLAALAMGAGRATGLDIDAVAIGAAAANARANGFSARCHLVRGGPEAVSGAWPLVVANILAAPLVEIAPAIVARVARGGRLVLSGVAVAAADEVTRAYVRLGMRQGGLATRDGWTAIWFRPTW